MIDTINAFTRYDHMEASKNYVIKVYEWNYFQSFYRLVCVCPIQKNFYVDILSDLASSHLATIHYNIVLWLITFAN